MFPAEEASLTYAGLKLNYTVGRKLKTQTCIMEDVVCGELVLLKGNLSCWYIVLYTQNFTTVTCLSNHKTMCLHHAIRSKWPKSQTVSISFHFYPEIFIYRGFFFFKTLLFQLWTIGKKSFKFNILEYCFPNYFLYIFFTKYIVCLSLKITRVNSNN